MTRRFDIVVVGGGSAGCVLANRVSANPRISVALIEAGPDTLPDHDDRVIWDSYPIIAYFDPRRHWSDLRVYHEPQARNGPDHRLPRRYEQAKVMGGGSSINGMMANRGSPDDYDEWEAAGATDWGWQGVLPYFRRLERDLDFQSPEHGATGPIPIRRVPEAEWPGFSRAAAQALQAEGLPRLDDQNAGFEPGYFPIAINNEDERRVSTAAAYLDAATRARPNLTILPDTRVTRVVTEQANIAGVEFVEKSGGREIVYAGEVVLCAGAIHTPALLLRSGIGPGSHLVECGIEVVADSPGVGQNLQEHPQIAVLSLLAPEARQAWSQRRHIFVGFRYSSGIERCPEVDMYGVAVNRAAWHPLGQKLGGFLIWVNKSYSTGSVRLESVDDLSEPRVEFNFLSDERDLDRLTDGLKWLAKLYRHEAMRSAARAPFPTSYTEKSRDLAVVRRSTRLLLEPVARGLDGPAPLRRTLMRRRVTGGLSLFGMVGDDVTLDSFVRERAHGTWHCCGTCRMGRANDPMAVADPAGRVRGVQGLRVADASIMPSVPRANTNIPTIMIAEKISDCVLAGWS